MLYVPSCQRPRSVAFTRCAAEPGADDRHDPEHHRLGPFLDPGHGLLARRPASRAMRTEHALMDRRSRPPAPRSSRSLKEASYVYGNGELVRSEAQLHAFSNNGLVGWRDRVQPRAGGERGARNH